jgi:hypothetical protein
MLTNIYIDHGGSLREAWIVHPRIQRSLLEEHDR